MAFGGDAELLEVGPQGRKLGLEEGFFSYPSLFYFLTQGEQLSSQNAPCHECSLLPGTHKATGPAHHGLKSETCGPR